MPLTGEQVVFFQKAIQGYSFPVVYYNFQENREILASSMAEVESVINGQLRSIYAEDVKNGLANILYWGYAKVGYRDRRIKNLHRNISSDQIGAFQALVAEGCSPTMTEIKVIRIPEYSGMSFLSKVLMFLNPENYCVLDQQIAKLRNENSQKALSRLSFGPSDTQIRISVRNEAVYDSWRAECRSISTTYYRGQYRVVDVERGFFHLVQKGHVSVAQQIYNRA